MVFVPYFKLSMTQLPSFLHRRRDSRIYVCAGTSHGRWAAAGCVEAPTVTPDNHAYLFLIKGGRAARTDNLDVFRMLPILHSNLF